MKTQRNILIAFILNLAFSVFEFTAGALTGSVAITSDAVHDLGDAASIGISYYLEKKSKKQPDEEYTYGYLRYSVIGGFITTLILLTGSAVMTYNALRRLIVPTEIDCPRMLLFSVVGITVNSCAVFFTRNASSVNQRAVKLHMMEDVLGWVAVLAGAVVMSFTGYTFIDPVISIAISVFIFVNSLINLREITDLFLEKTPQGINIPELKEHIGKIEGVRGVHHIHIWSMDGKKHYATMHIICGEGFYEVKDRVRREMREKGIDHVTIEVELYKTP
ncbi:MAG: cation transporter [Clostridia bacterium]|nr:cation transporter [Clostridia bacterium]